MTKQFTLSADYQETFGENPAVLALIDSHRGQRIVAPIGVDGPILSERFTVDREDLVEIK